MNNKICLISGGSSGVGKGIATYLAKLGATVVIFSKNEDKARKFIDILKDETGNKYIFWIGVDLSSQASIKNSVAKFKERFSDLDILVNAAGTFQFKKEITDEGIDKSWAVNYLSHFLLSNLLIDMLQQNLGGKIITVAGGKKIIENAKLNFEDLEFKSNYSGFKAAIAAARARVLFSIELADRFKGKGITSNAFHPGFIKSDLGKGLPVFMRFFYSLTQPFLSTNVNSANFLLSSKEAEKISGKFYNYTVKPYKFKAAKDEMEKLWDYSESVTGNWYSVIS